MKFIKYYFIYIFTYLIIFSCNNQDNSTKIRIDEFWFEINKPINKIVLDSHYIKSSFTSKGEEDEMLLIAKNKKYTILIKTCHNKVQFFQLVYDVSDELYVEIFLKSNEYDSLLANNESQSYNVIIDEVLVSIQSCNSTKKITIFDLSKIKNKINIF